MISDSVAKNNITKLKQNEPSQRNTDMLENKNFRTCHAGAYESTGRILATA
jgi:hypothetical protein